MENVLDIGKRIASLRESVGVDRFLGTTALCAGAAVVGVQAGRIALAFQERNPATLMDAVSEIQQTLGGSSFSALMSMTGGINLGNGLQMLGRSHERAARADSLERDLTAAPQVPAMGMEC